MSEDFYALAQRLRQERRPFVTATVVRVEPPTSGKPGDKAIVVGRRLAQGWVGGRCVEPVLLEESQAALKDGRSRLVRLAPGSEEARQGLTFHRMTCFSGGAMEIYIEPNLPQPDLLLFGTSPVAESLARIGEAAGFRVHRVDLKGGEASQMEEGLIRRLDDLPEFEDAHLHAVVATHGTFDESSLSWLLDRSPAYLGLITSRRRFKAIRSDLESRGRLPERLDRIKAPAGLAIDARTPAEIALSILAEIVAQRRSSEEVGQRPAPAEDAAGEASCCGGSSPF